MALELATAMAAIGELDARAQGLARKRQDRLTKPLGSLGRLEDLSVQLAGITGKERPQLRNKVIVVMAADHGVAAAGVSAYPQSVTAQMVDNFLRGGAAINVMARQVGARVVVVDLGVAADIGPRPGLIGRKVAPGTGDITRGPAMSGRQAIQALETGIEVVQDERTGGLDILGTGDMGIGNTTPSAAIAAVFTGVPVPELVGRGTGVDDAGWRRKVSAVERALSVNQPSAADGLDVLAKVGGFEIAGIAGTILGAAVHRCPVVIDGFISTAAAMIAVTLEPRVRQHLVASHCSSERGHRAMLEWMGIEPLLDMRMRVGEGTGAALGMFLAETSCRLLDEMATFDEAGVSEREPDGSSTL